MYSTTSYARVCIVSMAVPKPTNSLNSNGVIIVIDSKKRSYGGKFLTMRWNEKVVGTTKIVYFLQTIRAIDCKLSCTGI
jgi:hypothetical protein